jgi:hypothetical protein
MASTPPILQYATPSPIHLPLLRTSSCTTAAEPQAGWAQARHVNTNGMRARGYLDVHTQGELGSQLLADL